MISSSFDFNFTNICVTVSFLTKLHTVGVLFSTAVTVVVVVVVAKLLILGILFLTSSNLALSAVVVTKLLILGVSFLASFILRLRVVLAANLVISDILCSIF